MDQVDSLLRKLYRGSTSWMRDYGARNRLLRHAYYRVYTRLGTAGSALHGRLGNYLLDEDASADVDSSRLASVLQPGPLQTNTDGGETVLGPNGRGGYRNPVFTHRDVTDYDDVDYVADPFLFVEDGNWHLFMEVFNRRRTHFGAIAHATSGDGRDWEYEGVVLRTDGHLSFPYVFEWAGETYMLPDEWSIGSDALAPIRLYRASEFPTEWEPVATLISPPKRLHDFVVVRWNDRWWALGGDAFCRNLYAYCSDDLERDDWTPHADNPVVTNRPEGARPGGRPVVRDDSILIFLQDGRRRYGEKLRAYEITTLTPDSYADREVEESPVLGPSSRRLGWNSGGMHHLDHYFDGSDWHCVVNGNIGLGWTLFGDRWSIGVVEVSPEDAN
jgi:hypothetical protein